MRNRSRSELFLLLANEIAWHRACTIVQQHPHDIFVATHRRKDERRASARVHETRAGSALHTDALPLPNQTTPLTTGSMGMSQAEGDGKRAELLDGPRRAASRMVAKEDEERERAAVAAERARELKTIEQVKAALPVVKRRRPPDSAGYAQTM